MRKYILMLMAVACLGMSGCAKPKMNYVPQVESQDWPELNVQTTVPVGDEMLVQGYLMTHKMLKLLTSVDGACYDIPDGLYRMTGSDEKRLYFLAHGTKGYVNRSPFCDPFAAITTPLDEANKVCVMTTFGVNSCYDAMYEVVDMETEHDNNVQLSFIYGGRVGDIIKISFIERRAQRPSFSHDVTYDLKNSNLVNYRGARLEIHAADNEKITYTVLEGFRISDRVGLRGRSYDKGASAKP